jgi:ubiquinone/menaquinone biosynthesis C-methylase UbiE
LVLFQEIKKEMDFFSLLKRRKMLHIAPEICFEKRFRKQPTIDYISADFYSSAMVKIDITDIKYPDNYFDIIYCCHVLEHIENDRKAMSELSRVLKPDGWAILQVPIGAEVTFEDLSIVDPAEREKYFGQSDHVRVYEPDYKDRLEEPGFQVEVLPYLNEFNKNYKHKYCLTDGTDDIYFCRLRNELN